MHATTIPSNPAPLFGVPVAALPLAGVRVAVTGGTSGLGLALVERLRARGANVAFVARDLERVAAVSRRIAGSHGIDGDVAAKDQTHRIALRINAALGGLDVLINNASTLGPVRRRAVPKADSAPSGGSERSELGGLSALVPLADTECEDLEAALATNLVGPFRLTKALLGALGSSAREGRPALVLNIVSDAAVNAYANWGAYGASKAALAHLSRIWDEELRGHGIRVRAHDPGDMDTPLHALALPDADAATLKRPADAAREIVDAIEAQWGAQKREAMAAVEA